MQQYSTDQAEKVAQEHFERLLRAGTWRKISGLISRRGDSMQPFAPVHKCLHSQREEALGYQTVALDAIVGSAGREQDFDRLFIPRHPGMKGRWVRVAAARQAHVELPPVLLYRVGDHYFVQDGNHRVSVARALGETTIRAVVIDIDLKREVRDSRCGCWKPEADEAQKRR